MATVNLMTKLAPYVDETLPTENKLSMLTSRDFDWTDVHTVKICRVNTSGMNDYDCPGTGPSASRFGPVAGLDTVTEGMPLERDRSFTFTIDKLDTDETAQQLQAATALARQRHEIAIPEVDSYVYGVMGANAETELTVVTLAAENIYTGILKASQALDDAEAPETRHVLVATPAVYVLMKKCKDIIMKAGIGNDLRLKDVLATLDGANVVKVPAVRLPEAFGFLLAHPVAAMAPVRLEDYRAHRDPPDIPGASVRGRICYDVFVLDNEKEALYYQAITA